MVEVQDVLARYGPSYLESHPLSLQQRKAYDDILACRTAKLGGHLDTCPECGERTPSYNSCRNRHCPKCQAYRRERWVEERSFDLLDVGYYHVVFTVPAELNPVFYCNQEACYSLLFRCAWETVKAFAADPKFLGATTGATSVLHTWGRQLQYHPHVHMIVPSGGLTATGKWRRSGKGFFAPVKAMSVVFRAKLLEGLKGALPDLRFYGTAADLASPGAFAGLASSLYERPWVVYCSATPAACWPTWAATRTGWRYRTAESSPATGAAWSSTTATRATATASSAARWRPTSSSAAS